MKGMVPPDPETSVSEINYAIVHVPRRNRKRFPAACVNLMPGREEALEQADRERNRYPARVLGPSKSSEGQYLFYLIEWL